tara:strand:+ start:510 stop:1685 length:1176 start_codon:yes stop_codon:yes gene_type:complete
MKLRTKKLIDKYLGYFLLRSITPISLLLGKILNREHEIKNVKKSITVIKVLGGGNLFAALAALRELKKKYPNKKLILIGSDSTLNFANLMGVFDEIIIIKTDTFLNITLTSIIALKKIFFTDAIIDLEVHSKLTSLFSLLSMAKNRIGFYSNHHPWQKGVLTHKINFDESHLLSQYYEEAVRFFGIKQFNYQEIYPYLMKKNNFTPHKKKSSLEALTIGPYCSELGTEREFSASEWVSILTDIKQLKIKDIFIVGSKSDVEKSNNLKKELNLWNPKINIKNYVGKLNLRESVQIILKSDIFFTIDSGLNHIVRQLNMNIYSYWGPTNPSTRLQNISALKEKIFYNRLKCSPCVHLTDFPPCKGNNICMKQHITKISLDDALSYSLKIRTKK